jgi:hypothetical protein
MNKIKPYIGTVIVVLIVLAVVTRVSFLKSLVIGSTSTS